MTARSHQDILARIETIERDGEDIMGFGSEVLFWALEHPAAAMDAEAREYLDFAIVRIDNHRGISANCSVSKLREYAWLLGRDDAIAAMDAAPYPQYGAPKVKAFAEAMDYVWPVSSPDRERMAAGQPCTPDCREGCGR